MTLVSVAARQRCAAGSATIPIAKKKAARRPLASIRAGEGVVHIIARKPHETSIFARSNFPDTTKNTTTRSGWPLQRLKHVAQQPDHLDQAQWLQPVLFQEGRPLSLFHPVLRERITQPGGDGVGHGQLPA